MRVRLPNCGSKKTPGSMLGPEGRVWSTLTKDPKYVVDGQLRGCSPVLRLQASVSAGSGRSPSPVRELVR